MKLENKIISAVMSSRESFQLLLPYIDPLVFSPFSQNIFSKINKFYAVDQEALSCDREMLQASLLKETPKQEALITEYFASLPKEVSVKNLLEHYEELSKEKIRRELIQALNVNDESRISSLINTLESYVLVSDAEQEDLYNAPRLEDIRENFKRENLIPIFPSVLNEELGGGVPRESQIIIFARPDVGKTVTAINIAVGAAEAGYKVLYFGNEDSKYKMIFRIICRFTRKPPDQLSNDDIDKVMDKGYTNLFFKSLHPGTPKEIRYWVEKLRPDVFVLDQIRNVAFDSEGMTVSLDKGCRFTRNLAKEFNAVCIAVTQAGESAEQKVVLHYNDVEYSNTGVAGQADLMLGVGQNRNMKEMGIITLSTPKNKLSAPIGPITCNIDYVLNRLTTNG